MSLVGPRPEVPRYVALYTAEQKRVLDVRPGITDPASISFIDESSLLSASNAPEAEYANNILPLKLSANLAYAERATIASDLVVIAKTIFRLVRR
jgi:lipopolysaccharide/colanic/teichoic acid biosynthesis glycosyltransferase